MTRGVCTGRASRLLGRAIAAPGGGSATVRGLPCTAVYATASAAAALRCAAASACPVASPRRSTLRASARASAVAARASAASLRWAESS
eukprot:4211945-Prymnesium_polylepis.1